MTLLAYFLLQMYHCVGHCLGLQWLKKISLWLSLLYSIHEKNIDKNTVIFFLENKL